MGPPFEKYNCAFLMSESLFCLKYNKIFLKMVLQNLGDKCRFSNEIFWEINYNQHKTIIVIFNCL